MYVSRHRGRFTAGLLLVLWLVPGCASTATKRDQELDLKKADSHRQLGIDHLLRNRPEMALREFLLADRLNPRHPRTHYGLAQAYRLKAKYGEAEAHLLRALEVDPHYHEARFDLSTLYIVLERWEEARIQSQILIDDPTFTAPWTAHNNQGVALMHLGNEGEARRQLEIAREYNGRYWPTLLNLGILESREGHHLEAIEAFQQTLELKPVPSADAEVNYRLAEIFVSLGKRDRAMGHLKAAVARAPGETWGRKSEEYLKLLR